jgi:hypothetical protein
MMKSDPKLSGEARLKARRSAFWRYVAFAFAASFAVGLAFGIASGFVERGFLPTGLLIALWLLVVIGFAWGTRDYFRRIDEVDLQDNLWATTIGFYGYIVTLGSWFMFHEIGLVAEPDDLVIAAIAMTALLLAYGARKLGMR